MQLISYQLLILYFHILCLKKVIKLPTATIGMLHLETFLLSFKFNLT